MPTYERRGNRVRARLMRNGVRQVKTFDTLAQAKRWAADETSTAPRSSNRTLDEAMSRYARDVTPGKKGARWELIRIEKMRREITFRHQRLADLTSDDFGKLRDKMLQRLAPTSVARELNILSAILETARKEWKWIPTNPMRDVKKPSAHKPRKRVLSDEEIEALLVPLGGSSAPDSESGRVALAFLFALETAMRAGEICGLDPVNVFLEERYVHLPDTKNDDPRDVALTTEAVRILKLLPEGFDLKPARLDYLFRRARDEAARGMPSLSTIHFHDTRRTGTSRLAKKLAPMELAKQTGHRDLKTLLSTYYSVKASDLAKKLD